MIDLISSRTIDITKLAMDGLMMRQKAITANTANVMTPGYARKDVQFEDQLQEIVAHDDLKEKVKLQNSLQYNPTSLGALSTGDYARSLTPQQSKFLQSDPYSKYNPQIIDDMASAGASDGNNVDMEQEIMDMAKTGMQYSVLANLEQRSMKNIGDVIKG